MEILDFLGITRLAYEETRSLSYGQKKLMDFGALLMADPKIILLDEPAGGVNPRLLRGDRRPHPRAERARPDGAHRRAQHGPRDEPLAQGRGDGARPGDRARARRPRSRRTRWCSKPISAAPRAASRAQRRGRRPWLSCSRCATSSPATAAGPAILNGASLTVRAGQVQCIIGPNGAGKSTLLKAIAGLLPIRDGEIRFKGERIDGLRPDQILRKGICFVPQERALFPNMTVRENLRMGGYILADRGELEARIEEVLEQFPILRERARQHAGTLSGGQQQMLAMARTLIVEPEIVMLDEPSLGLAPQIVRQMFDIMRHARARAA